MISLCHTTNDSRQRTAHRAALAAERIGVDSIAACHLAAAFCFFPPFAMAGTTKPEKVFRSAGVSASVFRNTAKNKDGESTFFKVALSRTYRDGDEFKSTQSLGRDDLPVAALLLQRAWAYIVSSENAGDQ